MPRHWWIRVSSSNAKERKKDVKQKLEAKKGQGSLKGFFEASNGSLYALVETDEIDDVRKDIKALRATKMEDVPD